MNRPIESEMDHESNHVHTLTEAQLISVLTKTIVRLFNPIRVILFGSRARADARPDSDIDLLVVLPSVDDKRRAAVEMRKVLKDLPVGKDILVTTPDEVSRRGKLVGTVLCSALREGRVVFERS